MEENIQQNKVPSVLNKYRILRGDKVLWIILIILLVISLLVVYSSSPKMGVGVSALATSHRLLTHLFTIGASILVLLVAYITGCRLIRSLTPLIYIICLAATIGVRFFGVVKNGAARWFEIGGISLQPSEFLKLATILLLARNLASRTSSVDTLELIPNPRHLKDPKQQHILHDGFLPLLLPVLLSSLVIVTEHTSSGIIVAGVSFVLMYIGRIRFKVLLKTGLILCLLGGLMLTVAKGVGRSETAGGRISTWVHSWTDPHQSHPVSQFTDTERAEVAIYNGGITGVGAGQSIVRAKMTHPESDYVFSLFVEEYGIVLAAFLIMMYLWILIRAINIARKSTWVYAQLLVVGMALLVTSQAFVHMMVSVNLFPETGQNLPFVSHGGSSMLGTAIALGIILSVSRQTESDTLVPPSSRISN